MHSATGLSPVDAKKPEHEIKANLHMTVKATKTKKEHTWHWNEEGQKYKQKKCRRVVKTKKTQNFEKTVLCDPKQVMCNLQNLQEWYLK